MNILAVDDSPTILEILTTALKEEGHTVVRAANGAEASAALQAAEFDLIISDLNMIVMSGFELLHKVRENPSHMATPFVFLTSESDPDLKRVARQAGATAWMVKPFDPQSLLKIVRQLQPV